MLFKEKKTVELFSKIESVGLILWGTGFITIWQPNDDISNGKAGL